MNRDALVSLLEKDADEIVAALMTVAQIVAPWTEEEVAALAAWQASPMTRSYTCGPCRDRDTQERIALTPTPDGWKCQTCDQTQNWALASSLLPPPAAPLLGQLPPGATAE